MSESHICVAGILHKNEKILLGLRAAHLDFYPNVWDTIGGHAKKNETPEETLSRELNEEIGVTPIKFEHIASLKESNPEEYGYHEYYIYLVHEWEGTIENLSDEHSEIRWFEIEDALNLHLALPQYAELFKKISEEI